jgi:competence protein ComEC
MRPTASRGNTSQVGVGIHDKAFYVALFFILGIAAASFGIDIWIVLSAVLIFGLYVFLHQKRYAILLVLLTFLGFFYFNFYSVLKAENIPFGEKVVFQGEIFREPRYGLKSQELDLKLQEPYRGEVRVYTKTLPRYGFGEVLEVKGVIEKSSSGRLNIVSFPEISSLGGKSEGSLKSTLFNIKDSLTDNINEALSPRHAALMNGLLFGERAEFTDEFEDAMRKSGTTHIVALSGYNVAIIAVTLSTALAYFVSRRRAFWISILAILAFVVMTGAEASVVRAGIMGVIAMLAERQSRIYSFRNAITITALIMLLFNPRLLLFDAGFQLSFAALLGIVYFYPLFKKWFKIEKEGVMGWRRNFFQTLSAQLAVAPIILTTFGYLSPTALFANVLILELIPLTMLFGFITAVLGFLPYGISLITGWITSIFLGYEIFIINLFSFNWI